MEERGAYRQLVPSRADELAALAASQHGVVATRQLLEIGYETGAICRRVKDRRLRRVHHGVYTTGHTHLSIKGQFMAAVLACGPEAILSHHAAAALWDLRPIPQGQIDVTAPGKRSHPGVRCHISSNLPAADRTEIDGIPVTGLERTYLDYAEQANRRQLTVALEVAQRRLILDHRKLIDLIDRSPGRRGRKPLRQTIAQLTDDPPWTQSELEERFHGLIRAAHLPPPQTNVLINGVLVDFAWPAHRLIVEVDGYAYHRGRRQFEDDRRRDTELQKAGWRVIRVTHRRVVNDAESLISDIRAFLTTR